MITSSSSPNIFAQLGLEDLDDSQKDELSRKMMKTVSARVYLKFLETLDPEEKIKFDTVPMEETIPQMDECGFNIQSELVSEALAYRNELLSKVEKSYAFRSMLDEAVQN